MDVCKKLYRKYPGYIKNINYVPKDNDVIDQKVLYMFDSFIEHCIEVKAYKELDNSDSMMVKSKYSETQLTNSFNW